MAEKPIELPPELAARLKAEYVKDWRAELRRNPPVKERMKLPRRPMPSAGRASAAAIFSRSTAAFRPRRPRPRPALPRLRKPGCVSGCPFSIDIPSFIKLVEKGEFIAAAFKIKETNALPAICGGVCPQESQCEAVCNLKKRPASRWPSATSSGSSPITSGRPAPEGRPPGASASDRPEGRGHRGRAGGPHGRRQARQKGHAVTIFEALHEPEAFDLRHPRVPIAKAILKAEVEYLLRRLGVEIRYNFVAGKTAAIDDLKARG